MNHRIVRNVDDVVVEEVERTATILTLHLDRAAVQGHGTLERVAHLDGKNAALVYRNAAGVVVAEGVLGLKAHGAAGVDPDGVGPEEHGLAAASHVNNKRAVSDADRCPGVGATEPT